MLSVRSKDERRFPESSIVLNLGVAATVHTTLLVKSTAPAPLKNVTVHGNFPLFRDNLMMECLGTGATCMNSPVAFLIIIMIRMEVHTL